MSMIKKTKQYFGQRGDRFWLKASYLMLAVAVVILGITAIVDPDLYRRRSSAPAVDAEGDNGLSVTEDDGSEEDLSEGEESADLRGATLPTSVLSDGNDQYGSVGGPGSVTPFGAEPFIMPSGADFFEELKIDRDKTRSREREVIQDLIEDPNTHPDVRKRAQEALLSLAERARREAEAESMIQAKGYEQAVVFLSEAGASVVVKSGRLEEAEVKRIGDAVSAATGVELRRISIMEREP